MQLTKKLEFKFIEVYNSRKTIKLIKSVHKFTPSFKLKSFFSKKF